MSIKPLAVMALAEEKDHYSQRVRARWPMEVLQDAGVVRYIEYGWKDVFGPAGGSKPCAEYVRDIQACDVIVMTLLASPEWGRFFDLWKSMGKVIVVDMDDDITNVSPWSESYYRWGTKSVDIRTSQGPIPMWRDYRDCADIAASGESTELGAGRVFDPEKNQKMIDKVTENASRAHLLTTTTERSAKRMREWNQNVAVLPNCLDPSTFIPGRFPLPGFRVGWHGGSSHAFDVKYAGEAIKRFALERPDVRVVVAGCDLSQIVDGLPKDRLEVYPWVHADAHPWRLRSLGLDLGFCAVDPEAPFNQCKSPLKWTEFAALGVPTICTKGAPYGDAVGEGEAWLTDNTVDAWYAAFVYAYEHPEERAAVAEKARRRVIADFDVLNMAPMWYEAYSDAQARRLEVFTPRLVL